MSDKLRYQTKSGEYINQLAGSAPTKNQALAALRKFFDVMVQRHAVALNPFGSARGVQYSVTEGKTAELAIEQAQKLLAKLRLLDYRNLGEHRVLRFKEKNGKDREIPVRHDLAD